MIRFHTIAAINAQRMVAHRHDIEIDHALPDGLGDGGAGQRSDQIKKAAMAIACRGVSTLVETTVAIALAAS